MNYTVKQLSALSGVSVRTLHWYDKLGILVAKRNLDNQYRIYDTAAVDRLQQILFFRELGMDLSEIGAIIDGAKSRSASLKNYRETLVLRISKMNCLLNTLDNTILHEKGLYNMNDTEKFKAFKQELVDNNEAKYGEEIRAKFGDNTINSSNELLLKMGQEKYDEMQALGEEINMLLKKAISEKSDLSDAVCKNIALLHKKWLSFTWKDYSPQAHKGLCEMYVADSRFTDYYDNAAGTGAAMLLRDAVNAYC